MTYLRSSDIEEENMDKSPASLGLTSFSNNSNVVETTRVASTWSMNAKSKHPFFNKTNGLKAAVLPSVRPTHSRQYHRRRREHFSTKRKNSVAYAPKYDEEHAFDADVEDSDSTPEVDSLGTSKTSTMSCGSAEKHSMKLDQEDLITPPRRLIRSFQFIECSPLSLSFHSTSSSLISGESTPRENETNLEYLQKQKQKYVKKIPDICPFNAFREVMIWLEKKKAPNKITKEKIQDLDDCSKRENVKTSKQNFKPSFHLTKDRIFRLAVVIFLYSVTTVVMTTTKLLQIQVDTKGAQLKTFKNHKIHTSDPVLVFDFQDQNSYQMPNLQGNSKVVIKRTLGGLQLIQRFHEEDQKLDKPNRLRSFGFGYLDTRMYNTKKSSVSHKSKHPRIFHFDYSTATGSQSHIVRELTLYPTLFSDNTQLYGIRDSADPALSKMEPIVQDRNVECVPMAEWQSAYHPTCNSIHEMDLGYMDGVTLVGKKGYWRNAWKVDFDSSQHTETMILKTPR